MLLWPTLSQGISKIHLGWYLMLPIIFKPPWLSFGHENILRGVVGVFFYFPLLYPYPINVCNNTLIIFHWPLNQSFESCGHFFYINFKVIFCLKRCNSMAMASVAVPAMISLERILQYSNILGEWLPVISLDILAMISLESWCQ